MTEYFDFATGFVNEGRNNPDSRRLASAVRTQKRIKIPGLNRQVDTL